MLRQNQAIHGERRGGREEESRVQKENPAAAKGATDKDCRPVSGNSVFLCACPCVGPNKARELILWVFSTARTILEKSQEQSSSAPETDADGTKDSATQALHVIDNTVFQLYLAMGVNPTLTRENVKPATEAARRILFSELRDVFSNLTTPSPEGVHVLPAQTTHHLMELFTTTVSYEPALVLQFVRNLLRAFNWGYRFDSMAKDEIVKFTDIILADHKEILRASPNAVNMEAILAVFVEAGWREATQLLMKLDSVVR